MHKQASLFSSIPAFTNNGQAAWESRMRAFELFPHRHVQRFRRDALRFAGVGMTIIALVIGECSPITATVRRPRTATPYMVAGLPSPITATASLGRLAAETIGQWPLRFEDCDKGGPERFLARTSNCNIHLTATEATLVWQTAVGVGRLGCGADLGLPRNAGSLDANEQLPGPRRDRAAPRPRRSATDESLTASVRMQLIGANPRAVMAGEGAPSTPTHYFIGDDPKRWRTNVPGYLRVKAENVYRGVDVIYYGKGRQFEYDFKVAAGADPAAIRLRFAGARRVTLDQAGDLLIETTAGQIRHCKPIAYQEVNGARQTIASRFVLQGRYDVGFAIAHYDRNLPLVIDPVLNFASLLQDSTAGGVAVDAAGNIYLTGSVFSSCLPTTPGAVQPSLASDSCGACSDVFIAKLDPTGTTLIYSTFLGGSDSDDAVGIAVDTSGNAYVTGRTRSNNFPVTPGAFQTALNISGLVDAFVAKLNPAGTALIYSTYLGGRHEDLATAIAADASGNAYVAGYTRSSDFPVLNALQSQFIGGNCIGGDVVFTCTDAFITKLDAAGALAYSTFIGGNGEDRIAGLAADGAGNVYATGTTASTNFPVTTAAFQTTYRGDSSFGDAFALKLNATGSALAYSTYLGGGGTDSARGIAVDAGGSVYVTGDTSSTDFPITPQAVQPRNASNSFFTSTNGGSNWRADSAGPPSNVTIQGFAIDPTMPATLYAGTNLGLYRSTDGGHSWRRPDLFPNAIRLLALDPKNPAILYIVISDPFGDFLFKITDGGMILNRLSFYPDDFGFLIPSFVIDPQDPSILYVVTNGINRPGNFPIVIKSTDGGHSWQGASKGLPVLPEGVTALAIDPNHTATLYASARGAYRTVNGGHKWTPITSLGSFNSLVVSPADSNVAYAATNGGVFKSVNGGTKWKRLNGLPSLSFSNVQLDPVTPSTVYVTSSGGGIFKSTDSGTNWAAINAGFAPGQGYLLGIDRQNPATLYAQSGGGGKEGFVTRLNADGSGLIFSTYLGGSGDEFVNAIALDPLGNVYVAGSSLSRDFPIREALQNSLHKLTGGVDAFVTKLSGDGSTLVYSTYLGRAATRALAVDAAGSAYVAGETFQGTALVANVLPQRFGTCNPFFQRDSFVLKIADAFSGFPAPVVQAISPTKAPSAGGTEITITGSNFMPGAAVRIAGVLANHVRVLNSTTIKAVTAPSAGRFTNLDVAVINPDGQSNSLVEAFTYLLTPIITRVEISGRDLIVFGTEFDIDATILLNGEPQNTILLTIGTERRLLGKKLGKRIKPGETVTLQVQHDNGIISAPFVFTRPPQ
jgi:IPT/TIG domain/Beta-propeller repeat